MSKRKIAVISLCYILGTLLDIAELIETPELYILARCPANDQQLMYSPLRLEDLSSMHQYPSNFNGVEITDKMRFFKGITKSSQALHKPSLKCFIKYKCFKIFQGVIIN